ncbi:glycosyltransferase family 4 protein [Nostoc sp.]|uniref:glycosyltransferase family 4 protein n=1 Tax=Nostoc sp. TaxID=1180 RepID=UPI002FF95FB9
MAPKVACPGTDEFVRDRNRIQQYLSAANVYTLPRRQEGFPVAPVEAMACGAWEFWSRLI